jgi:peptide/nickel transport system substrate-binding protein
VEFRLDKVNPIFLQHLDVDLDHEQGLGREEQGATPAGLQEQGRELRRLQRQRHRALHAGQRQPASRPPSSATRWWGKFDGNVQEIVFTPIANDATRLAALISGEIDFVLDPAPRDIARLRNVPA